MSESTSSGEKTEAPSTKRRDDAFNEGQIPKTPELSIAVSLLAGAGILTSMLPNMSRALMSLTAGELQRVGRIELTPETTALLLRDLGGRAASAIFPVVIAMAATMVAVNALQARGVFSFMPLMPKWERISPMANAKRLLGKQQIVELVKSLAKFTLVGSVVYPVLTKAMPDATSLAQQSQLGFLMIVKTYVTKLLATAGISYFGLAAADYVWQWWRHEQSLKMTKEDLKQEMKQQDGDPNMKQRRRSIGRARARRKMMSDVKNAHVIITNPTHIAIALRYDPKVAPAPIVLAIGQELVAQRIKELAREAGIPMVENRPLARALLKSARVGSLIPVELYVAVAEVLAFVFRTRSTRGDWTGSAVA